MAIAEYRVKGTQRYFAIDYDTFVLLVNGEAVGEFTTEGSFEDACRDEVYYKIRFKNGSLSFSLDFEGRIEGPFFRENGQEMPLCTCGLDPDSGIPKGLCFC